MNLGAGVTFDPSLPPPERNHHRIFGGMTPRQELVFDFIAGIVVLLFVAAWIGAFAELKIQQREAAEAHRQMNRRRQEAGLPPAAGPPIATPSSQITKSILGEAPATAFLQEALGGGPAPLRGFSGQLRFATRTPGTAVIRNAPEGATAVFTSGENAAEAPDFKAPAEPGIYNLAVKTQAATKAVEDFNVITLVPFAQKEKGRIGSYLLGSWPFEGGGTPRSPAYANPNGFIRVTPENQNTQISAHFRLRDFLTKDQASVWPKYLLLNPNLLDKLELTIQELEREGHHVGHLQIMSGFRTPQYNHTGGNPSGRANLSRHMYGDASDVFVDNDGNGAMDDLNHDGRVDIRDSEVIQGAVEQVERKYPALVGGVGVYVACCGHGPFTHIDVRGSRARWRGTSGG